MKNDGGNAIIQNINNNEKAFTYKIFKYFYSLFQEKKEFKSFFKCAFILLETIQFISYAFIPLHRNSWKMETKKIRLASNILSVFRLSSCMKFLTYKIYVIVLYFLLAVIFLLCLIVLFQILFINSSSKVFRYSTSIIRMIIDLIVIFLYIPLTEIILIPIKCVNGKVYGVQDPETCGKNTHILHATLGLIGTILLTFWCIFMIYFSFYPFKRFMSTIRIYSNNDIIIIIVKFFIVLHNLIINNEYISIFILLLSSIIMFFICYNEKTYNNNRLEIIIIIKNCLILWTYFVLLIAKLCENIVSSGFIFLFISGIPIVIGLSLVLYKERDINTIHLSRNIKSINDFVKKAKFNIRMINSFIERNLNLRSGNEEEERRYLILLKGNIRNHNRVCTSKECPLTRFLMNDGNFNVQKQCLLNYMNVFFNKGFKLFPNNAELLILNIYFNYSKKFNLNSVKNNIFILKTIKVSLKQQYIIFCMEQNARSSINEVGINLDNNKDSEYKEDITQQKYQKLKYLIENSIKLYGEFWGIFSTNVSSNINTNKLYSLGEKLNIYLSEINNLWDNELKNRKISNECQSIVQLYSKFLLEVLWDQKKSKEVYKKLNDENLNNYQLNDNKKSKEEENSNSIEAVIDNQDFILFGNLDEKGNCKISQISASLAQFLGYKKYDIIGKQFEILLPNILIEEHCKYLSECLRLLHNGNNLKDLSFHDNESSKNNQLIMIKNRMGYIYPLFECFSISDDNDYSDSFLVKSKMETKENKTEYAYYILTNTEFTIENISSSAINLGLTLDLLKKYVVKMDILLRTDDDRSLNIFENYIEYMEEPKEITWVFPHIIYPKDNNQQPKEDEIEDLLEKSPKKGYNLQIFGIKFNENENISFVFKLTEKYLRKKKLKFKEDSYIPKCNKNLIMFDLLKLKYIRTIIVDVKTGLKNLRTIEKEKDNTMVENNSKIEPQKSRKRKKTSMIEEESSDESEKNKNNILLTKEKILELQVHNYLDIKNFIFSLPMYGGDVNLEKFRPTGDKYSASKIHESLIKIHISTFCKRMEEKFHLEQNMKKKKSKNININNSVNSLDNPKSTTTDNYLLSSNESSQQTSSQQNPIIQNEEMNKGLASDSSSTLANIFKANSLKYIKIVIGLLFLFTFILILVEFLITYRHMGKITKKLNYLKDSYIILNDMIYVKYFITEGVIGNTYPRYICKLFNANFSKEIKAELEFYRQELTKTYDSFTSKELPKKYKEFLEKTKINIYTLTLNNPQMMSILFNSAMVRISSAINDLTANSSLINMANRDTYELMYNLLNEYFLNWEEVCKILFEDSIKATSLRVPLMIIVLLYYIIFATSMYIFLKLLARFSLDREKPINLFLTLKKVVFENLKNSAETFSNKLLNKFFGNEDNEDDSQQDYQANIQPSDINIVKFKAVNEYNSSISKAFSFLNIIIIIFIFLIYSSIFFIAKYLDFSSRMGKNYFFINLFEKLNYAQIDFILNIDIFKSYFFNRQIPILNNNDTIKALFIHDLNNITIKFRESIIYNTNSGKFLNGKNLEKYVRYLNGNFQDLLDKEYYKVMSYRIQNYVKFGIKPLETRVYEMIRYYILKYCASDEIFNKEYEGISYILKLMDFKFIELTTIVNTVVRVWYNGVSNLLMESFYEFQSKSKFIYSILFICFIIILILYYSIIWKTNEEKLNGLLKESAALINLIPQEIKNIIIEKLNE